MIVFKVLFFSGREAEFSGLEAHPPSGISEEGGKDAPTRGAYFKCRGKEMFR